MSALRLGCAGGRVMTVVGSRLLSGVRAGTIWAMSFLRQLLQQNQAEGKKSSILRDLKTMIVTLLAGTVALVMAGAPATLTYLAGGATGLVLVVFLIMFVHFSAGDPDRLQSEQFILRRTELEQTSYGSHELGMLTLPEGDGSGEALLRATERLPGGGA